MLFIFFIFYALLIRSQVRTEKSVVEHKMNAKIVNGSSVELGERPFQAYLDIQNQYCGGVVINRNYVVTAAHCVLNKTPEFVTVYVGLIDSRKRTIIHKVSKLIIHENYSPAVSENDIALIKVKQPFVFSKIVSPIPLMRAGKILPNTVGVVSGWGATGGPDSKPSPLLRKAEIYVVDQKHCADIMHQFDIPIHSSNICAFNPSYRKGHCNGDSGGPLTINGELAGLVSWSLKDPYCASTKYPNVYTRVSSFIDWIEKHTA